MPRFRKFKIYGPEQTDLPVMARILHDGNLITQAAISSISVAVKRFPKDDADSIVETLAATPVDKTTTVFDTLQTPSRWTEDDTGYNFLHTVPASAFPEPGIHEIVYLITPVSGSEFPVVAIGEIETLDGFT